MTFMATGYMFKSSPLKLKSGDEFPYVHDIVLNNPNFVLIFIGLSLILLLTYIGGPNGKKCNKKLFI
jgi:hypothetical protein